MSNWSKELPTDQSRVLAKVLAWDNKEVLRVLRYIPKRKYWLFEGGPMTNNDKVLSWMPIEQFL